MATTWHIIVLANVFWLGFLAGYFGPTIFRALHKNRYGDMPYNTSGLSFDNDGFGLKVRCDDKTIKLDSGNNLYVKTSPGCIINKAGN